MGDYKWTTDRLGATAQVSLRTAEDVAQLAALDPKMWMALSMPVAGVRFDARTLELMDTDRDGRIRIDEVLGAISFLQSKGVDLDAVLNPSEEDAARLADVLSRRADLAKLEPSAEEREALAAWESKGLEPDVNVLGSATVDANAALAAVEPVIDAFFTPPDDMPLVTDAPDVVLPLADRINPKHLEPILSFAEKCVVPLLGERAELARMDWKRVKSLFAPYRAWVASKPVVHAAAQAQLDDEERILRYKLHLGEFLENFVNMKRLYRKDSLAIFQMGTLRIDGKELHLCFHVESEAAHAALAAQSNCCVIYLKLVSPASKATRSLCAVVTAGRIAGLYVGRNGVFCDRDGCQWEATVTKVVENQVSLVEAFWAPWKKLGESVAAAVKKFLGDRQKASESTLAPIAASGQGQQASQAGGAALASSVAAIGIAVGMVGAAMASFMAAVATMVWWKLLLSLVALVLVVSLPSVILAWFKLRRRDLCAILNASGWAVNRAMRFSVARARAFTQSIG